MRRAWLTVAIVVAIAAIAVAVIATRLSGDETPSAAAWAESVCASLAEWRTSIVALTDVSGGLDKASLQEKLGQAEEATATLVSDLRTLGPPDLASGAALEAQLDAAIESLERQVEALKTEAEKALDEATTPTDLFQSLATLAPQFRALLGSALETASALRDSEAAGEARAELRRAFDEAASCRDLRTAT
jgi:hypothetical protein